MYAKVFAQMFDGTLCTKGPWQALVTFQQMLILADQEGNVDMTAAAISRRTTIPLDIIEIGIDVLLLPDPESRTPAAEGRRLLPLRQGVPWGWLIVNYKEYRNLKREEDRREYHRAYWHKRKEKLKTSTNTLNSTQHAQPNQPITEAKAYEKNTLSVSRTDEAFETFWSAYPKKTGKGAARKSFERACKSKATLESMLEAIEQQRQTEQWRKDSGQYVPMPATWLNQERWSDEIAGGGINGTLGAI